MDCLQLPFIRLEEAVSWTKRFLTRKFGPKIEVYFWKTNLKANVCKNSAFQVNRKKKLYRKTTSYLEQPSRHFCQHFMRRTTQQTLLAINLASQQKTTKLYFSSQVRKQFKLLAVPFKPLRCCLRNDKLVNCHVWKFCKDLFLNFRVIWSVNQIVLFNGFLSDFVKITGCVQYVVLGPRLKVNILNILPELKRNELKYSLKIAFVPLDNREVSSSRHRYFAWNSKKGDRRRWSLVSECGPCSVTQVSSTKKTERKNMIVSTRKRFFHNISCIFFLFLM